MIRLWLEHRNAAFIALFFGTALLAGSFLIISASGPGRNADLPNEKEVSVEDEYPFSIGPGSTLYSVLSDVGVPPMEIGRVAEAAKPIQDLSRVRTGTRFKLAYGGAEGTELIGITFRMSPVDIIELKKANGAWAAGKKAIVVNTQVVTFMGHVNSTLWESAENAKMDPNLISELAEIFAWQVDFAREVRMNDRWRISVEQKIVDGRPIGWGRIIAAEYENAGQLYSAVLFRTGEEVLGYFAPDGTSLRRMFLKSPIRFGRISSTFQRRRFHPILKIFRPHLGVDYAAPRGTPVHAVGNGTVTFAGWNGDAGYVLRIRHNSIYETAYKHLSGYAKGISKGVRVQQGQVVAMVGSTGLSTASHLHFEFYENGKYINPQGKKFPSAEPVPTNLMSLFISAAKPLLSTLPAWSSSITTLEGTGDLRD